MLLPEDSPASPSVSPDSKEVQTIPEICGLQQSSAFASYDHESHSWKTSQASLLTNTYEPFSGTWPKQGIMLGGVCWERTIVDVATEESEYGLLRTPDTKMSPSSAAGKHGKSVAGVVASLCPTPRMNDYKGASRQYEKKGRNPMTNSCMDAVENGLNRGLKLQPAFVEWMMRWPHEWTDLKPLEMDKFQEWLRQHLRYLQGI